MTADDLIGAWKLEGWDAINEQNETTQPYGDAPAGFIMYTPDGYMSAQIRGNGGEGVTPEGLFLAYAGPYEIDGETVIHKVEIANWYPLVGSDQPRQATFDGDQLTLSAEARGLRHFIRWRKTQ